MRYPFLLSVPLLAYARWRGYSWYEVADGVRHGYWDFRRSRLLRILLPWTMLLDAALAAVPRVYWPLWRGCTVVCERFVLDMLVDLAAGLGEPALHTRLPGRLYPRLIPRGATVVCLDLDAGAIRARRPDLVSDRRLEDRVALFRSFSAEWDLRSLSSAPSVGQVGEQIRAILSARQANDGRGYARLRSLPLQTLARIPFTAVAAHWAFQGLLYMDRTERLLKLGLDLALVLLVRLLLGRSLPSFAAWAGAFAVAHTINLLLNGHLWGALKHYGFVRCSRRAFAEHAEGFLARALKEPAVESVWICGGLSREAWSPASDLDVRLLRRPGVICATRACWFLLRERSRALWARFPLDAYVVDSRAGLLSRGISSTDEPLDRVSWCRVWGSATWPGRSACPTGEPG